MSLTKTSGITFCTLLRTDFRLQTLDCEKPRIIVVPKKGVSRIRGGQRRAVRRPAGTRSVVCVELPRKKISAARPKPNHRTRKNLPLGGSPPRVEASAASMQIPTHTTPGRINICATLALAARFGFFAVSACHMPT